MTRSITAPTWTRATRAALALLLATAWLLLPGEPALAAGEPGVERPAQGERITTDGAYDVVAYIDATYGEEVRGMEARLSNGSRQIGEVHAMDFVETVDAGPAARRTRWVVRLDPIESWDEGYPLRNGSYRIEVRATVALHGVEQEPTPWRGVDFLLDVDPPATSVSVRVADPATRRLEVSWDPVLVPDFTRYVIQRRIDGGEWTDYREVNEVGKTVWADNVPADGEYAYRVQTYRTDAAGQAERRSAWSQPASASVQAPPETAPEPADEAGEDDAGSAPPVLRVRRPPTPRQPTFTGPDTYEETLDYSDAELPLTSGPEEVVEEPEVAAESQPQAQGTLRVREDQPFPVRQALVPVATGLVFTVTAWHVRRFMRVT